MTLSKMQNSAELFIESMFMEQTKKIQYLPDAVQMLLQKQSSGGVL